MPFTFGFIVETGSRVGLRNQTLNDFSQSSELFDLCSLALERAGHNDRVEQRFETAA